MVNKERDQIDYSINFIVCIVYGYCGPNKDFGQKKYRFFENLKLYYITTKVKSQI